MPEVTVLVCDVCRDPAKAARRYTIAVDRDAIEVLLCGPDAKPIETLRDAGRPTVIGAAPKRRLPQGLDEARLRSLRR